MKKLLFTSLMIIWACILFAQVTQEWVQTYTGGNLAPWNKGIALDNTGNIYATGSYYNGVNTFMLLQKYDATGNLIWTEQYLPSGYTSAKARAVVVDGNGDVIVTGVLNTSASGFTRKYDAAGQLLWSQSSTIDPFSITSDEYNNIYITSWDLSVSPMQIIKYNAAGNLLWTASSSSVSGQANGRLFYKSGFLYRTGGAAITISGKTFPAMYTRKYNASTGALVWAKSYYHADKISQAGWDLVVDAGGNVYVTGYVNIRAGKNTNTNWVTLKYNSAGTQQWVNIYDGNGDDNSLNGFSDSPNGMTIDNSGNIIVCGKSYTTTGSVTSQDMATIKYSSAGSQLWLKTYDGSANGADDAVAITSDVSDNIYITGVSTTASGKNASTIKYNASGDKQWDMHYASPGSSVNSYNIQVNPGGDVYAAGSYTGPNSFLVKYSQGIGLISGKELSNRKKNTILSLNIFPNPSHDILFVSSNSDNNLGLIQIFDQSGRMVFKRNIKEAKTQLNIQSLPSGIYILNTEHQTESIRFYKVK